MFSKKEKVLIFSRTVRQDQLQPPCEASLGLAVIWQRLSVHCSPQLCTLCKTLQQLCTILHNVHNSAPFCTLCTLYTLCTTSNFALLELGRMGTICIGQPKVQSLSAHFALAHPKVHASTMQTVKAVFCTFLQGLRIGRVPKR